MRIWLPKVAAKSNQLTTMRIKSSWRSMIMLGAQTCASPLAVRIGPTQGIDHATSDIRLRGCAFGGDVAILGSQCSNTSGAIAPNQDPAAAVARAGLSGDEHSGPKARRCGGGDAACGKPQARLSAAAR